MIFNFALGLCLRYFGINFMYFFTLYTPDFSVHFVSAE